MKHFKSKSLLPAMVMLIALAFSSSGHAQIGDIANGLADKRRQKKIEKSPAKEHILAVEKNIPSLEKEIGKYTTPAEYRPKDDKDFARFGTPFNSIEENLKLLKEKDPEWDVAEYEAQFSKLKPTYNSIKESNDNRIKSMDLADKIFEWPTFDKDDYFRFGYNKSCSSLYREFKNFNLACDCGQNHYKYYVEDIKLRELRVLLADIAPIIDYLPSSYHSAQGYRAEQYIKSYLTGYEDLIKSWIEYSDEALKNSDESENAFQSIGVLSYYKKMMETALAISDIQKAEVNDMLTKLNTKIKSIKKQRLVDNKITEANIGKFYFLNADISRADFKESDAISTWNLGDPIYFRWFMPSTPLEMHQSLNNAVVGQEANQDAVMTHIIYVDGKKIYQGIYDGFRQWPDLYSDALTMRGQYEDGKGIYDKIMRAMLDGVSVGSHKLKIEAYMDGHKADMASEPFASGEITLNVTAAGINKIKNNEEVCFPKAGMQDGNVIAKVRALMKDELEGKTPYSIHIISNEWAVDRNEYSGVILSRGVDVQVLYKDSECEKVEVWVEQKYNGNGSYAELKIDGISASEKIPCKCMN